MIQKISEFEGEEKEILTKQLANHMKKSYLMWNKDAVEDEKIFMDLEELSEGKLELSPDFQLTETKNLLGTPKKKKTKQNKSNKRH
jgi:hypothetical protein